VHELHRNLLSPLTVNLLKENAAPYRGGIFCPQVFKF